MAPLVLLVGLILGVFVVPGLSTAQTRAKLPVVGVLTPATSAELANPQGEWQAFLQGLRALGYIEEQTVHLEYRYAAGQGERLPALAAELVQRQPEVIVTNSSAGVLAASQATRSIPIVMAAGGDLVELGLAASLARPGSNITGQILPGIELEGKRLELLKDAVPTITHVVLLVDSGVPSSARDPDTLMAAAQALGVRLQRVETTPETLDMALATLATSGANALLMPGSARFNPYRQRILEFARTHQLPTACGGRGSAAAGCLVAYGTNIVEMFRRAAIFVDKILKGATPADLPIERPYKFDFFLNLKTAAALGLTLPPTLLRLADEVLK